MCSKGEIKVNILLCRRKLDKQSDVIREKSGGKKQHQISVQYLILFFPFLIKVKTCDILL